MKNLGAVQRDLAAACYRQASGGMRCQRGGAGRRVRQDRVVKARRYAALGVPHYWMVDPEARRIECYRAQGGAYALVVAADGETTLEL